MPDMLYHYTYVERLYNEWMYHEAADRGYNFAAASAAQTAYLREAQFFKLWWLTEFLPHGKN